MSAVKPTIKRRESTKIYVGNVPIGGDAPIAVQSMTNTRTTDVDMKASRDTFLIICSLSANDAMVFNTGAARSI